MQPKTPLRLDYPNPASVPALDPRRWRALALLCGAFFMVILDSAIVIVALPSIEPTSASRSTACSGS